MNDYTFIDINVNGMFFKKTSIQYTFILKPTIILRVKSVFMRHKTYFK